MHCTPRGGQITGRPLGSSASRVAVEVGCGELGILGDTVSRRGGAGREDGRFGASAWASARTVRRARDVMGEVKRAREHSLCEQPHEGVDLLLRSWGTTD